MASDISMETGTKPVSQRAARRARKEQAQSDGQCTAKSKRSHKRCRNTPVEGRATCRMHGGNGGRPLVHGRFSELPERVRAKYYASLTDETLFDHTQTAALLDSLVKEACARAADLDTPQFRKAALELLALAREQITDGKDPIDAIGPLEALLDKGLSQVIAEDRLFRLGERLDARLAEANRLKLAKQNAISSVDLVGVMQGMLAAIQRLAPPELAKSIADELEKILGGIEIEIVQPVQIGEGLSVFSVTNRIGCEQKGDAMSLACQPVYLIAYQLVAGLALTAGSNWERAVFRNGAHRWALVQQYVPNVRGVIVERVQDFDECVQVGNVVAFTGWDPNQPDVVGPTLAIARLAAIRDGLRHDGASYVVQQWQTLQILGGPRG